ncbi:MAG TPA: zinc ribbon domain-containing protein [Thermoanaerobaculia bacterium]|nr:zinc ribbon domain-containing protein [Thermoanaerobaculia bacterium]
MLPGFQPRTSTAAEAVAAPARCPSCGSPVPEGAPCCPSCGAAVGAVPPPPPAAAGSSPLTTGFQCQTCGAQVLCEPGISSYECAFCGSTYVVELPAQGQVILEPEYLIPFRLDRKQATALFDGWCHRGLFTPRDVRKAARMDRLKGVYLPFWTFSMRVDSDWEADIGEHWQQRIAKDKKITRTEWHPLAGQHHRYLFHHLVSGAQGLPQEEADEVRPFDLTALRRYRPELLAGWLAEPASVPREEALAACQEHFREREGEDIATFLPGDKHRGLEWTTRFSEISDDLVLLPFWIGAYSYRGKVFRFVVNGQSGQATGTRPLSPWKIGVTWAVILLAILALILLFSSGRG